MTENYDIRPDRLRELLEFAGQPRKQVQELELAKDGTQEAIEAFRRAEAGQRTRVTRHGRLVAMITPCAPDSGPAVFRAIVYGDTYPAMIEAAEAEARGFYGPDATLAVERTGIIHSTMGATARRERGEYNAEITIRCANLPDGWIVP
jgi:antitoxin (DNA-binding transcriptional repressor) of toxin-antitoxin stability system